jgi:predicted enzyme related to lactoylglutathione lyase
MTPRNGNLEVVLGGWIEGLRRNDPALIERHLHPDVVWQGVRPDLICRDRAAVLDNVGQENGWLPEVEALELVCDGDQVMLGVGSPDLTEIAGEILDEQIYNVLTIADGLIVRMEEHRTRDEALDAMRLRRQAIEATPTPLTRTPAVAVDELIPFIHVSDVTRSIAFYELLGFAVADTHSAGERLDWAALNSNDAKLMLAHAEQHLDARDQGILFYLFTDDLQALQTHLRAHGARAGAIRDGSPGPSAEMRVSDPDGYVLMIAQRDR